ncbi:MAG: 7TM-DISM domain-containing protein, partial [Pseudomonadota bacterium]
MIHAVKHIFWLLPCLFYIQMAAGTEAVKLSTLQQNQRIVTALDILEDPDHRLTIESVKNSLSPDAFEAVVETELKLTNSTSSFWLRLQVHNPESTAINWYLTYGDTTCDYLKVFVVETDGRVSLAQEIDDGKPFSTRPVNYRKPAVLIETPANTTQWIYLLKRADEVGAVNPRLFRLWSYEAFNQ